MSSRNFERFESDVMLKIAEENPDISVVLKAQYENAKIVSREFTGVGFYTTFEVSDKKLKLDYPDDTLGDVQARLEGVKYGVGFALFIRDGFIDFLEGYTYGESWPIGNFSYVLESPGAV